MSGKESPDQNAFTPNPQPLVCETFKGINTQVSRPAVPQDQLAWSMGFMPIGPGNCRTLYGAGDAITVGTLTNIVFFDFGNIGSSPMAIVVGADGSAWVLHTDTGLSSIILPIHAIENPSAGNIGVSQWGSQYIIIVSQQTNGYWLYDGAVIYTSGGLAPLVTITAGGTGYSPSTTAAASGGSGTGATFSVTVSAGVITGVTITNPGTGYVAGDAPTLAFTDPAGLGAGATATITIMPFDISGSSVETYQSRVWVANGTAVNYSSPGSPWDFDPTNGAGTFTSNDSFLRVAYTELIQSSGFLYLIGDSSINYISGVTTSGSPVVTTFSNLNANPEIGTPYPATVDTFNENIVFINDFGAQVSYGSRVTKISDDLDGVFNTVPNSFGGFIPSAAKAIIFSKRVWMILIPVIDPLTGQRINTLFIWDGKIWFPARQEPDLIYIQHQEINSILTAWGTDGASMYRLFQRPSASLAKTIQSRFWAQPIGYHMLKTATRWWGITRYYDITSPEITLEIDSEAASVSQEVTVAALSITWFNDSDNEIHWLNDADETIVWRTGAPGVIVLEPEAIGNSGALLGFTVTTNSPDMAFVSMMMQSQPQNYRG